MTLEKILIRIVAVGSESQYLDNRRSLLHAYVACLTFDDLCLAIPLMLAQTTDVRVALRGRLLRLLGGKPAAEDRGRLIELVDETGEMADNNKALRQTVDALHSSLLRYLPIPTQHSVLQRWIDRGTRGAMARWLKATRDTPSLFDASVVLLYWRTTRDCRAAKSLAYQASPEMLRTILSEIVAYCGVGWVISKAIIRAGCGDESTWNLVRANHPATYLYLCAQLQKELSDDDAFDLVWACPRSSINGDRGLAIWAIGQMGKSELLDRVSDAAQAMFERDIAELLVRHPETPTSDGSGIPFK